MVIKNIPLIKQIICGVHTEKGLDIASNYHMVKHNIHKLCGRDTKDDIPSELKQIAAHRNNLLSKLMANTSIMQATDSYRETNLQITIILNELIKVLNVSIKENTLFYAYKNEEDLTKGQQVMLELGLSLQSFLDNLSNEHRVLSFKIIELLLDRAEFGLSSMSINISEKPRDQFTAKLEVCNDFINFMMNTLQYTLEKLSRKVNDDNMKHFIEYFLSVAYFRIPKFRKAFLKASSKDVDLSHLKEENDENCIPNNPIVSLIDWQNLFYNKLASIKEIKLEEKLTEIDQILLKSDWQERMKRRGLGFLFILSRLEKYISRRIVTANNINWTDIPGFKIIIESLVHELKTKQVYSYPKPLLDILLIFINDHCIMNRFLRTIVCRTK